MILSAGLKVNLLVHPSHCPVYLPTKLAVEVLKEVELSRMTATARKLRLGAVLVYRGNLCKVRTTLGTENTDGIVIRLVSVVLRASFFLGLGHILCLEGVENLEYLASVAERLDKIISVLARTVHLCLISAIQLDTERGYSAKEFILKVLCVIFVTAPRVWNVNVGAADVFVVSVAYHRLNVCGDLTATVKLVPRNKKASLFALLFKSLYNEKACRYISEVSDVNRA